MLRKNHAVLAAVATAGSLLAYSVAGVAAIAQTSGRSDVKLAAASSEVVQNLQFELDLSGYDARFTDLQVAEKGNQGKSEKAGKDNSDQGDKGGQNKDNQRTSDESKKDNNGKSDKEKSGKNDDTGPNAAHKRGDNEENYDRWNADRRDTEPRGLDNVRRYFGDHPDEFEAHKLKPLPPGIEMNLERGKPLPPGIARTRLPDSLADQLPRYRGYDWSLAGQDLVLTDRKSNLVVDVYRNMFPYVGSGDIDNVRRYYTDNPLAFEGNNPKPLPPGIAKNLERGKPLPPGIVKTRLPSGVASQLPEYDGYDWSMVGQDLVLTDRKSNLVVDLYRNLFP